MPQMGAGDCVYQHTEGRVTNWELQCHGRI